MNVSSDCQFDLAKTSLDISNTVIQPDLTLTMNKLDIQRVTYHNLLACITNVRSN